MKVENLIRIIGADFYTGVPDSQLKALCDYLMEIYGISPQNHIIGANEGNCVALAAGYHLATGKVPVVYMQNSGEGNIVNPVVSLLNNRVYAIPMMFIIGWRGEPGVHDEPQHAFQGEVTLKLLEDIGIDYFVIDKDTADHDVKRYMDLFRCRWQEGAGTAFIIKKNVLSYEKKMVYKNDNILLREEILRHIVSVSGTDPVISTTGKTSRELFEIRTNGKKTHDADFLTVGSMGHCSSIALGVALNKPKVTVWCIDGDGAALMHLGALPVIASAQPHNLIHIVINNGAHETVGGQPTVMRNVNIWELARDCGYSYCTCVNTFEDLDRELIAGKSRKALTFIEVKGAIGARKDLGRPTTAAKENKNNFMRYLKEFD